MHTTSLAPKLKTFDALVADDDAGVRDLLTDFLSDRGLEVASAADGRGAVAALERSGARCRLVLADIAMPGADGFAVLTAARLANPSSYVVMMTGYGSLETAINAVRLGAQDYLTKPFSLGEVDVVLRQATARHELEQEQRRRLAEPSAEALAKIEARLEAIEKQIVDIAAHLMTRD
jgi:two-component system response regulator AtoC